MNRPEAIFFFDLRFYYIPENEISKFYIYSLIYSTLGILAAAKLIQDFIGSRETKKQFF